MLQKLVQLSTSEDKQAELESGFDKLLLYVPLLDLADSKCK